MSRSGPAVRRRTSVRRDCRFRSSSFTPRANAAALLWRIDRQMQQPLRTRNRIARLEESLRNNRSSVRRGCKLEWTLEFLAHGEPTSAASVRYP